MKHNAFYSSETELWYPYNGPRIANEHQVFATGQGDFADCSANRQDHSRLDRLVLGS
jgi:hypothetical protein